MNRAVICKYLPYEGSNVQAEKEEQSSLWIKNNTPASPPMSI